MQPPDIDLSKLTTAQKLALIEQLWDSLDEDSIRLTASQKDELDRRIAEYERTRDPGVPWETVRDSLRG